MVLPGVIAVGESVFNQISIENTYEFIGLQVFIL